MRFFVEDLKSQPCNFFLFQLSVTEVKFSAIEEERDILKSDQENSNAAKDELIKKAWETRDAAVKRKNNTEIELARTRIGKKHAFKKYNGCLSNKLTYHFINFH